mgnify:FL=1
MTGVQTCALPISEPSPWSPLRSGESIGAYFEGASYPTPDAARAARVADAVAGLADPDREAMRFIMTSRYEDDQAGVRALAVSPAAVAPVLIAVSVSKGHAVAPLIRDSRAFAVNGVAADDLLVVRKFPAPGEDPANDDGPLDAMALRSLVTGAPALSRANLVFDCELVHHFDLEADHEMYIGLVLDARAAARRDDRPGPDGSPSIPPRVTPPWL